MNIAILISVISTFVAGIALILSYIAFNHSKLIRLRDRAVNIRTNMLDQKYKLLQIEINISYLGIDDVEEEKDLKNSILLLAKGVDELQNDLDIDSNNFTESFLDRVSIKSKDFDGRVNLMDSRINKIINRTQHDKEPVNE